MSHTHENLFLGMLPKRLILWYIDNDANNGEYSKNPFNAKNNAINFLAVYVDGRQVPTKPLQPNSLRLSATFEATSNCFPAPVNKHRTKGTIFLIVTFGQCYTFFGFDLTPDGCNGGCFHFTRKGTLRIEMHFATALEHTVNVIVYGEFEAVLEIDKGLHLQLLMETDHISRLLAWDPLMCHYEVVAKDALPEVVSTYPSAFVCKTHDSDQPGEHWVAMYVDEIGDYFDPY